MDHYDIIIIGAGACGLVAARALAAAGKKVHVLEGRDRVGGRIHTLNHPLWPAGSEAGAEFIHGRPSLTTQLLAETGVDLQPIKGSFWQVHEGAWCEPENFVEEEDLLIRRLKKLQNDMSIADFLEQEFPGHQHEAMKASFIHFVEGYDAAEISRASAIAFREEWLSQEEKQHRVKGGYTQLVDALHAQFLAMDGTISLNSLVKTISWKKYEAELITGNNISFSARQVIITIPLGLWQAPGATAAIDIAPDLPAKWEAAGKMGFGSVIKILLLFNEPFWNDAQLLKSKTNSGKKISFIFSDSAFPTWWTQAPSPVPLLTGWVAGPRVERWKKAGHDLIKSEAIRSVAYIFGLSAAWIENKLKAVEIFNWASDPFSLGAYAYTTTESAGARHTLAAPVEDTLFFAGEALYEGPEMGTVEAALGSGLQMASLLLKAGSILPP